MSERNPIEQARDAILALVPKGYGMTDSEAESYARAAIVAYLRARAEEGDVPRAALLRLADELNERRRPDHGGRGETGKR